MNDPTRSEPTRTDPQPPAKAAAAYPVRRPLHNDRRFTVGLVLDIAEVLHRHGYPALACGNDLPHWQNALFTTIYRHDSKGTTP